MAPSFSQLLKALPKTKEKQLRSLKYINVFMLLCAVAFSVLVWAGWQWKNANLIYSAYIPLFLVPLGLLLRVFVEARNYRKMHGDSAGWILGWLDQRFEEEKALASNFSDIDIFDLKQMLIRLEAEIVTREKWLDVIKPFSILIPAVVIVVGSSIFHLPNGVREAVQLMCAAILSGLTIGSISIYAGLVKLRRLASTLHYAIEIAEKPKENTFRKVSRKRKSSLSKSGGD